MAKRLNGLWLVGCGLFIGLSVWAAALTKSVQVRTAQIRQRPSFLGQVIKEVPYGEQVQVLTEQPPWFRIIDMAGSQGWMHDSALTSKRIVLHDSGEVVRTAATSDEIALAGKGFNEQVEAEFQKRNPVMNYTWVDRMEGISISVPEMEQFLRQGGVKPAQGGV
jgi:hypothetical protein